LIDAARSARFVLASGVVIAATREGLVATFADGRLRRIDLRDRAYESEIASSAAAHGIVELDARPSARDVLLAHAVIVPMRTLRVDDRIGLDLDAANPGDGRREDAMPFLVGWLSDASFHAAATAAAAARAPAMVACTSAAGAWIVHDDGAASPCAHCALLLDSESVRSAVALERSAKSGATPTLPIELASILRAWIARWARSDVALPAPGRALVWDSRAGTQHWESLAAHPGCPCAMRGQIARAVAPDVDFRSASRRRFTPIVAVSRDDGGVPARVVYRGTARSWPIEPAAFGVAMASAPNAPPRALAEAIERFAMLHAPPDVTATPARDAGEILPLPAIESLLFRREDRSSEGFPFPSFSPATPLDWSWATGLLSETRLLVPTTLVGRVRERAGRLVHATSNGYACHVDREKAIRGAVLEVIERDAVLLAFHLSLSLRRIDGLESRFGIDAETYVWLATQDVELPVVLAASLLEGKTRIAAAAGVTFDEAVARTVSELRALVASRSSATRDSGSPAIEGSPTTHQEYYDGPGRDHLRTLARRCERLDASALAARWHHDPGGLTPLRDALAGAGLSAWIVDRGLPSVFGPRWHVVRALVPGAVELSWGMRFRRLASPRVARALASGAVLSHHPHPIA